MCKKFCVLCVGGSFKDWREFELTSEDFAVQSVAFRA